MCCAHMMAGYDSAQTTRFTEGVVIGHRKLHEKEIIAWTKRLAFIKWTREDLLPNGRSSYFLYFVGTEKTDLGVNFKAKEVTPMIYATAVQAF